MIGGLLKSASPLAVIAAAGIFVGGLAVPTTPVRAADLGGDCCADLEERVAELEATTVRHGNRKVSLTISGWVNVALLYWDEEGPGGVSDVYVVNNDTARSRINFGGEGAISSDVSAGYRLQIRPWGDVTSAVDFDTHSPNRNGIAVRNVYVYLKSKAAGELRLGLTDAGSDDAWYKDLGGSTTWIANYNPEGWVGSFGLRRNNGAVSGLLWGDVLLEQSDAQVGRLRYLSPTWSGFSFQASWGGDDTSGVGLYYDNTFNTVSVALGVGYDRTTGVSFTSDQQCFFFGQSCVGNVSDTDLEKLAVSGSIYESGSGLFAAATYAQTDADIAGREDPTTWYAKIGWRKNVNGMGETALYAEYARNMDGPGNDIDATMWGLGVTQDIDATGGTLYLGYRHHSLDACTDATGLAVSATCAAATDIPEQDMNAVMGGFVQTF